MKITPHFRRRATQTASFSTARILSKNVVPPAHKNKTIIWNVLLGRSNKWLLQLSELTLRWIWEAVNVILNGEEYPVQNRNWISWAREATHIKEMELKVNGISA
jgi:hypothetical protein